MCAYALARAGCCSNLPRNAPTAPLTLQDNWMCDPQLRALKSPPRALLWTHGLQLGLYVLGPAVRLNLQSGFACSWGLACSGLQLLLQQQHSGWHLGDLLTCLRCHLLSVTLLRLFVCVTL